MFAARESEIKGRGLKHSSERVIAKRMHLVAWVTAAMRLGQAGRHGHGWWWGRRATPGDRGGDKTPWLF